MTDFSKVVSVVLDAFFAICRHYHESRGAHSSSFIRATKICGREQPDRSVLQGSEADITWGG